MTDTAHVPTIRTDTGKTRDLCLCFSAVPIILTLNDALCHPLASLNPLSPKSHGKHLKHILTFKLPYLVLLR